MEEVWPCGGGVVLWRRSGLVKKEWPCGRKCELVEKVCHWGL